MSQLSSYIENDVMKYSFLLIPLQKSITELQNQLLKQTNFNDYLLKKLREVENHLEIEDFTMESRISFASELIPL